MTHRYTDKNHADEPGHALDYTLEKQHHNKGCKKNSFIFRWIREAILPLLDRYIRYCDKKIKMYEDKIK